MQCDDDMQTCFLTFIVLAVLDCLQPSDTFKKMFFGYSLFNKEYTFLCSMDMETQGPALYYESAEA